MAVTDCYSSPDLDAVYPERWSAAVEIEMTDGRVYETRVEYALGEPKNPLSGDALRLRFWDLVGDRLRASATQQLEDAPMGLNGNAFVRPIADAPRTVRAA